MMSFLLTLNPFIFSGLFCHNFLDLSISNTRMPGLFLLLLCFIEISGFDVNSVDPDQMPYYVASDQGLQLFVNYPD